MIEGTYRAFAVFEERFVAAAHDFTGTRTGDGDGETVAKRHRRKVRIHTTRGGG